MNIEPKWRRSSTCADGSCVEVAWQSACASSNCVEVACSGGQVLVRDSKLGDESEVVVFEPAAWARFIDAIKGGLPIYRIRQALEPLSFTDAEMDAFQMGAGRGEFDQPGSEWRSAALADVDPDTETQTTPQPAQRALSPASGPVPADDHPAVQAVLNVTPINPDDGCVIRYYEKQRTPFRPEDELYEEWDAPIWGDPAPLAAKQAAAVLRWLADTWKDGWHNSYDLTRLADTIDPKETTQP